ncbi:hypothetical protein XO10_03290 [Marinitoga sp. 1135]|uniref:Phosphate transport regulator related to PhoU n=1 Tax=Marinitoga piezophila (strain DSM 14283 / JCM 11233 / KA3) TaxID=443254 RepID=H2J625_MARPK|nr:MULTISPECIES: DUF47 family protein [Marinitoga]AEX85086.1 phosphate transport regulator related to PhoU [Marinitoga piezophila KA3]APT75592.1 hypothetical protein LN42_03690 [Marinitoga sp. 1137]NUU95300.1 hypothetical protein [Marinitoga sp. 1135]NUU97234.1 hypothetical protein [Marinitoga sp. 1138]
MIPITIWGKVFQRFNPIDEIIKHARIVEEASDYLPELFKRYLNQENIEDLVEKIDKLEDDADDIKRNFRQLLKKGHLYRFERIELLEFIDLQDSIIDLIEDVAKKMTFNQIELEEEHKEIIFSVVNEIEKMLDHFKKTIKYLKIILSSDFSKETVSIEEQDIKEMKWFEKDVDNKLFKFGKWLYSQKNTMNPIDFLYLRELILLLARIADVTQNVCDRVHILINE